LNRADVAAKRLRDAEDGQHPVEGTAGPGALPALSYDAVLTDRTPR
jgi:hypothetical protein